MKVKLLNLISAKGYLPRKAFWTFAIITCLLLILGLVILFLSLSAGFTMMFAIGGPYFVPLLLGFIIGVSISTIWNIYLTIAMVTHIIRRLRDANFSPYLSSLYFIPFIGWLILIILLLIPSRRESTTN